MAKDPYKYFRIEARELLDGLSQGIIELEKSGGSKELVGRLLRLAHTLKGAARVVKQKEVSESAHSIEDLLTPFRDARGAFPKDTITHLLEAIDTCDERLKPVFSLPEQEPAEIARQESEGEYSSVRVETSEVDALLYGLADAGTHLGSLFQKTASFERAAKSANTLMNDLALVSSPIGKSKSTVAASDLLDLAEELSTQLNQTFRSFRAGLERAHRDIVTLRDRAADLRLLPARSIFSSLERAARDAAETLKKTVNFEAVGGEHRLDAHVLLALRDALAHVVRNAVGHGFETESKRTALGKPPAGTVRLQVYKKGQRIHFVVSDDGGGINMVAIRESLVARKIITVSESRTLEIPEAIQLLFQGGISTAPEVTEVMGRGIGLDVVRSTVARLKGEVSLRSEPDSGTSIEIMVPVSMESMDVLSVVAGEVSALIPFSAVRQTVRLTKKDLARSADGAIFILEEHALPFLPLAEILGGKRLPGSASKSWTTLVVHARGMEAAVGVDRLNGVRNVVVRPLPTLCGSIPFAAGATLDGDGNPELVLDPSALISVVRSKTESTIEPDITPPSSVLVVDDSLTSRMLEQSILETAGYQVDVATCGEEALEKARIKRYAIFIVDVEMPGMNGFELLEKLRVEPISQKTPAILVTSRASAEDRQRGKQAGADAHIAKGEFEEGHLLRTIRNLIEEKSS